MPAVNPGILIWARETAGLELNEAAKKLGFQDSKSRTAADKLMCLEVGKKYPTRNQITDVKGLSPAAADKMFYLSEPPQKGDRGEDFRTIAAEVFRPQRQRSPSSVDARCESSAKPCERSAGRG